MNNNTSSSYTADLETSNNSKHPKHLKRRIEKNNEDEKKRPKGGGTGVIGANNNDNGKNDTVADKMALLNLMKPKKSKLKKISADNEG